MLAAILGVVGVVVGFAAGSGYAFWAARRQELAAAVVATATLAEVLSEMTPAPHPAEKCIARDRGRWEEQRGALTLYIPPDYYPMFTNRIAAAESRRATAQERDLLISHLRQLHALFWSEHHLFILVPLSRKLRRGPSLTSRIVAIFETG
jgi:hypothetical protein